MWVTDDPPTAHDLDSCVTCGLCLPACPTFRLTGDETASPRGRIATINAVQNGLAVVDSRFDEITSFCLQCRACETACPSLVPYGKIIEAARAEAVAQVPRKGSRVRRLVLGRLLASRWLLSLLTSIAALLQRVRVLGVLPVVGRQTHGLRQLPVRPSAVGPGPWGDPAGPRITIFTGCVADAWFADVHRALIEVLVFAGYRVDAPTGQTCCGALAAHGGFSADAVRLAGLNIAALTDVPEVVVDVAGCGAHIKGYGRHGSAGADLASRTLDATEVVASAIADGRLPTLEPIGVRVAVQHPCHLEHGQRIVESPRSILRAAGYDVLDVDPGGPCCGAAGLYQVDHPETGEQLGRAKAAHVRTVGASIVASANAGCEMQLRRFLDRGYRIAHPVELYAERLRAVRPR